MYHIGAILIIAVGLLMALSPNTWWEITESWKSNGTEASDSYITRTRWEGIFGAVVGAVCLLFLIFNKG